MAADGGTIGSIAALSQRLSHGLIGHETLIERLLISLLSGGHVLIEGAPGLAKTRAVKLLAAELDVTFARIQCTPDLMPADITGTTVWRPGQGLFEFVRGPLFHGLVLVDEVNRAPPKVQSALLEAMAESQITVAGETHALSQPFMVVATQNSIEHEGTYPLPEAQLDRFLMQIALQLPGAEDERRILDLVEQEVSSPPILETLAIGAGEIGRARVAAAKLYLAPALKDYIVRLVTATRGERAGDDLAKLIQHPVSPRGTIALAHAVKARAWLHGRDHATPDDVVALAADALAHRLILTWRAQADGVRPRDIIAKLLDRVQPA